MLRRSRHRRISKQAPGLLSIDPLLILSALTLCLLGELNLLAIGAPDAALHQGVAVAVGIGLFLAAQRARSRSWAWLSRTVYGVAILMLLGVVAAGVSANGARRWLTLGNLVLQPSELAKLGLLLILCDVLSAKRLRGRNRVVLALAVAIVPIALTMLQPDLSTASLLVLLTFTALLLGRVPLPVIGALVVGGLVTLPLAEHFLRPYQVARLQAFLSGRHDLEAGWQLLQAHIAVASGGLFGTWTSHTHQLLAQYLPARETDLAFVSLIEQWGLATGAVALLAVSVIVFRLVSAARSAPSFRLALMPGCLAMLLGTEAAISVGGSLGNLPLAGVPFPLLSFGGTAAAVHLAAFGLVLGAKREAEARSLWLEPSGGRRSVKPRLVRLGALGLASLLFALAATTYQSQQASGAYLRLYGIDQMTRCFTIHAPRGAITDRHGALLAGQAPVANVYVLPRILEQNLLAREQLTIMLHQPPYSILKGTTSTSLWTKVGGEVPMAQAQRIANENFPGVLVLPVERRAYPEGALVGPIIGFVARVNLADLKQNPELDPNGYIGRSGIEAEYDDQLRGHDGEQCILVDPTGAPVEVSRTVWPTPGAEIRLSLDLGLQKVADAALQRALRGMPGQPRGDMGAAIVLDPQTGDVLAMASRPAFDNSIFGPPVNTEALRYLSQQRTLPMLEHATQTAMPPGSTFKLVVAAADTVYRAIPPKQVIPTGYVFRLGTSSFHSWTSLPPQNLTQAIAWSNDVYFYKVALALGPDNIYRVAHALGVGQPTGIDLPGEASAFLGNPSIVKNLGGTWYPGSTVILGIGQGAVTATPLQVARWTGAVSTGQLVTPHLGLAWSDSSDSGFNFIPTRGAQRLSFASTLGPVRDGLRMAVQSGTGTMLRDLPVPAGGKTGTAEDPNSPDHEADAWFTAVAPMNNPEVVATVMVRGAGEGYYTSEPAVNTILTYYFAHRQTIRSVLLAPVPHSTVKVKPRTPSLRSF